MIFNVWTFLFEVVNFLVLLYVLRRILYRPLHDAIDRRKAANAKAQADAEQARAEASALQQKLSAELAGIDAQRQDVIRKAREQADAERKASLADVEQKVKQRRQDVEQEIERTRSDARQALQAELEQSAITLAARFLEEASNTTLQQQLTNRLVDALEHIDGEERERLRAELSADDSAVVETAADMNGQSLQALGSAVEGLAGRKVELNVQSHPELRCGLRLRFAGHVWDATLTGALEDAVAAAATGSGSPNHG